MIFNNPQHSIPAMFGSIHQADAAYDFLKNEKISYQKLIESHRRASFERMKALPNSEFLIIEDTTAFNLKHLKSKVGPLGSCQTPGLFMQAAICIEKQTSMPMGVIDELIWARPWSTQKKTETGAERKKRIRESEKWGFSLANLCKEFSVREREKITFVADRESDVYEVIKRLENARINYVLRACKNRLLQETETLPDGQEKPLYSLENTEMMKVVVTKKIHVHGQKGRPGRDAEVEIGSRQVVFLPPKNIGRNGSTITANLLIVREKNSQTVKEPLLWYLLTNKKLDSVQEHLSVLSDYESRWTIEEFFKGLKTGCDVEGRQLESRHSTENFIALASIATYEILKLRVMERQERKVLAREVMTKEQIKATFTLCEERVNPKITIKDILRKIAILGGFMGTRKINPGWQTIWVGMQKVNLVALALTQLNELESRSP